MPKPLLRRALPALIAGACALPLAHADIYTWTDDKGRVNISNVEPPAGAHVTSVLRESKEMKAANEAARAAALERLREAEVQALAERVRQLQAEVEAAIGEFESRNSFKPDAPFDHVFGSRHEETERQRLDFLENLRREAAGA